MNRHSRTGAVGVVALLAGVLASVGPSSGLAATPLAPQTTVETHTAPGSGTTTATRRRDGRLIFTNVDTGQIETSNPDGSTRQTVSPAGEVALDPVWGPHGGRIAFSDNRGGNDFRLFVARPDGTGLRMVTDDEAGFSDFSPAFTADGRTLIYTRCRPDPPGGCALFSIPVAGGRSSALTRFEADRADFQADVSPDGRWVAFARFGFRGIIAKVWLMRLDGTHAHPITSARLEAGTPRWTPDGRHLLVTSVFAHLGENVFRIRTDGSHRVKLTHERFPHNAVGASPSPSGSRIVFADDRAYPKVIGADLFVMRKGGAGKHPITREGRLLEPDWGTAPLVRKATSTQAEARPPPRRERAPLPPWAAARLGGSHAGASPSGHAGPAWRWSAH